MRNEAKKTNGREAVNAVNLVDRWLIKYSSAQLDNSIIKYLRKRYASLHELPLRWGVFLVSSLPSPRIAVYWPCALR